MKILKETLENRGVLGQMKARMRAEVFHALDDQLESRPTLSNENMLINELIREYLQFNKYNYSLSVLMAESGQPRTPLDRAFITNELNITEDSSSSSLPLLYGVLSHFLDGKGFGSPTKSKRPTGLTMMAHKDTRLAGQSSTDGVHAGEPVILPGVKRR